MASREIDESDPRLDFFSEHFDAEFALKCAEVKVPDETAKTFDNLEMYKANVDRAVERRKKVTADEVLKAKEARDKKWLPHQLPVPTKRAERRAKRVKNIFDVMGDVKGPLAILRRCAEERLKVKIYTRNQKGIRGYCTGYIAAFDKHWNLALEDVTEFWTRPKKKRLRY